MRILRLFTYYFPKDNRKIDYPGIGLVSYELSRRAKKINISIRPGKVVRVAIPVGVSFHQAESFVFKNVGWISKQLKRLSELESRHTSWQPTRIKGKDKTKAGDELKKRLAELALRHGFSYNRVFIRQQKTRWGSCSKANNISLNIKLAGLPNDLRDYVILHELVHTRIKNHGPDFWKEMNQFVGDARGLRKKLNNYRI